VKGKRNAIESSEIASTPLSTTSRTAGVLRLESMKAR
jgi:hypothetical protein